jgi:GNAT superfamily N-acetyltransferase
VGTRITKVRRAAPAEFDEVAAFCAGRGRDAKTREIKRRRRYWLEDMAPRGLTVLLALDPKPPRFLEFDGERVNSDELTLFADGLAVGLLEYVPIEETLYPVEGRGSLFVDCLWVIPPYRRRGAGRALTTGVIREARARNTGVATIAWRGEAPPESWSLVPAAFFRAFGFDAVDEDGDRVLMAIAYGATEKPSFLKAERNEGEGVEFLCHPSCPASLWAAEEVLLEAAEAGRGGAVRTVEAEGRDGVRRYGALLGVRVDGRVVVNRLAFPGDVARVLEKGERR